MELNFLVMSKKIFLSAILLLFSIFSFSQDLVKFVDGSQKKLKLVGEVESFMIFKNPETQQKDTIHRSKIEEIIFVNGDVLKVTKIKKGMDTDISKESLVKEYELRKLAISTEILPLFWGDFIFINFELYNKKSSFFFTTGKSFLFKDLNFGVDYRLFFNNPEPSSFDLGDFSLGKGCLRFFASAGILGFPLKSDKDANDLSVPTNLGMIFTLTYGPYISIMAGPEFGTNISNQTYDILPTFRFLTGYRFNKKK
jgi:hypothetical protein